jgi:Flp pilus assembly protein TadG
MTTRLGVGLARKFAKDDSAAAVVEFGLLMPFLITLLFAGIDITEAVTARRKAVQAASAMSDLIAQAKEVTTGDIANVFTAGTAMLAPFDGNELETVVTSVRVDANRRATVAWSVGQHAPARTAGTTFPVPDKLLTANSSLVVAEINFDYKPVVGYGIVGTIRMPKVTYALPRVASKSTGVPCKWAGC